MRIRTRIAVALVASTASACAIVTGFGDLQTSATLDAAPEASRDDAGYPVGDSGTDPLDGASPNPDANTENDSSPDAAANVPFCSLASNATALFCDDFDDGAFGSKWDSLENNFQNFGEYTSKEFVSGARSLHVTFNALGDTSAYFQKTLDVATTNGIQVDFDVKSTSYEYARWFGMNINVPGDQIGICRHFLFENGSGGGYQAWLNNAAFPQDGWAHVTIKLEKDKGTTSNGALTLLVNSSVVHNRVSPLSVSMLSLSSLQLRLGIFFSTATPWEAWIDNFVATKL